MKPATSNSQRATPGLLVSAFPVIALVSLLAVNVGIFGDDATSGANQIALFLAAVFALAIGMFGYGQGYKCLEKSVLKSIGVAMQANLILLVIGALIGIWILSGIVPTMIYYGLIIISPRFFLPISLVTCSLVSISTGSSWSTMGTVGIALMGIGKALGVPDGMVAGAIISGAYFGDKLSPLSDTTNLAPAMAGTDVFTHIRNMLISTVPAVILAALAFFVLGLFYVSPASQPESIAKLVQALDTHFRITPVLLLVPALVVGMVVKRIPALPSIVVATLVAGLAALLLQQSLLQQLTKEASSLGATYRLLLSTAFDGFHIETGHELLDSLLSRGGMKNMLNTVWLILMAMVFGGAMEGTGMLGTLAGAILSFVRGAGSLVGATLASCIFVNLTACDQYLSIVVPGRMFKQAYETAGLHPKNLSRALEDGGTITSVLIPWNTCGAYTSTVLGVPTLTYLPFCFFNLLNPLISAFYAGMGIGIYSKDEPIPLEEGQESPAVQAASLTTKG